MSRLDARLRDGGSKQEGSLGTAEPFGATRWRF